MASGYGTEKGDFAPADMRRFVVYFLGLSTWGFGGPPALVALTPAKQIRCRRCNGRLARVCPRWRLGEVRQRDCEVCGQPHEVARDAGGNVYVSAWIEQPLQPRLL